MDHRHKSWLFVCKPGRAVTTSHHPGVFSKVPAKTIVNTTDKHYRALYRLTSVEVEFPKSVLGSVCQLDRVKSWLPSWPLLQPGHSVLRLLPTATLFRTEVYPSWMPSTVHSHLGQWVRRALQSIPACWESCRCRLQGGGAHILPW